jgi:hypothetical protein
MHLWPSKHNRDYDNLTAYPLLLKHKACANRSYACRYYGWISAIVPTKILECGSLLPPWDRFVVQASDLKRQQAAALHSPFRKFIVIAGKLRYHQGTQLQGCFQTWIRRT